MGDWTLEQVYRDFWSRPVSYPILRLYNSFMNIKRYDRMPYYIAPAGTSVVNYEDEFINYLDWTVDAHEDTRNVQDSNRDFYSRAVYCKDNYLRYQNDTVGNLMFDVQAPRPVYDKINATVDRANTLFYASTATFHALSFMYMSFFFRYRRVGTVPALGIGAAYYIFFENVNNIMYKLIVDRPVLRETRRLGFGAQAQPVGMPKNRGINYI